MCSPSRTGTPSLCLWESWEEVQPGFCCLGPAAQTPKPLRERRWLQGGGYSLLQPRAGRGPGAPNLSDTCTGPKAWGSPLA